MYGTYQEEEDVNSFFLDIGDLSQNQEAFEFYVTV